MFWLTESFVSRNLTKDWNTDLSLAPATIPNQQDLILPAFESTGNTWRGASYIAAQFIYATTSKFCIDYLNSRNYTPTPSPNYCLCVRWLDPTSGLVVRRKLWENVFEDFDFPLYQGEVINTSFALEAWTVITSTTASNSAALRIGTALTVNPTQCDDNSNGSISGTVQAQGSLTFGATATYYNTAQTHTLPCDDGRAGSDATATIPAGTYGSNVSQAAANALALTAAISRAEILLPTICFYVNTEQTYTATCPAGLLGSNEVIIDAGTYQDPQSQAAVDAIALQAATDQAIAGLVCVPDDPDILFYDDFNGENDGEPSSDYIGFLNWDVPANHRVSLQNYTQAGFPSSQTWIDQGLFVNLLGFFTGIPGRIDTKTTFNLTVATYRLSFKYAGTQTGNDIIFGFILGNVGGDDIFVTAGTSWTAYSIDIVVSTATTGKLSFFCVNDDPDMLNEAHGPLIDDVKLERL